LIESERVVSVIDLILMWKNRIAIETLMQIGREARLEIHSQSGKNFHSEMVIIVHGIIMPNTRQMTHRDRIDTFAQILETVNDNGEDSDGVTQTTIRYEAFLGGAQLKESLIALTIHGLLSYDSRIRRYSVTEKGLRFLQIYYNLFNIVNQGINIPILSRKKKDELQEQHITATKMTNLAANNNDGKYDDELPDRLLVVDDDPDVLQTLKLGLLDKNRFLVDAFTNPDEALQSFKANAKAYRLMLSDIRMPSLSGIELARKVKEINLNVKVILITAFQLGDNEFSELFSSKKIDAFLQKPIGISELNKKVLSLL